MKKALSLVLALVLIASLAACGEKAAAEPEFPAVADAVQASVPAFADMAQKDADYIKGQIGLDSAAYVSAVVMGTNVGTSRDEYGIFKCADEKAAAAVETACKAYIQQCIDNMMGYTPEELPKLEAATVTVKGTYVIYTVMDEEAKTAANAAFEGAFAA